MTVESCTQYIVTNENYVTVESATNISFTASKTYTMQVQGSAHIKIADAEFYVFNEKFQYKAGSDDLYIKTSSVGCTLTILEEAE